MFSLSTRNLTDELNGIFRENKMVAKGFEPAAFQVELSNLSAVFRYVMCGLKQPGLSVISSFLYPLLPVEISEANFCFF